MKKGREKPSCILCTYKHFRMYVCECGKIVVVMRSPIGRVWCEAAPLGISYLLSYLILPFWFSQSSRRLRIPLIRYTCRPSICAKSHVSNIKIPFCNSTYLVYLLLAGFLPLFGNHPRERLKQHNTKRQWRFWFRECSTNRDSFIRNNKFIYSIYFKYTYIRVWMRIETPWDYTNHHHLPVIIHCCWMASSTHLHTFVSSFLHHEFS